MRYNNGNILKVKIINAKVYENEWINVSYKYDNVNIYFKDDFEFILPELHELIFDELILLFYSNENQILGVVKIKLKKFLTNDFEKIQIIEMYNKSYMYKSDFYDVMLKGVGIVELEFKIKKNLKQIKKKEKKKSILNVLIPENQLEMYRIAYQIFLKTNKGSFTCKFYWFMGFIYTTYYYTYLFDICKCSNDKIENKNDNNKTERNNLINKSIEKYKKIKSNNTSIECKNQFCFKSYEKGKIEDIEEAIRCLQYAAASFGDAIITWNLEKVRNMNHIKHKRMRAILERLDGVDEEDILVDYLGGGQNLGFLAFLKDNELVISFRGTLSIDDMILDLNCDYVEFQDGYAHRGIKDLVDIWISEYWISLEQRMIVHDIKRVLLTGYSLGGAVAVLTYLRLQEMGIEKRYNLKSITFSNPPIISENIAKRDLPQVKIYIYNFDFVSRLSYGSIQDGKYMCISLTSMCDYFIKKENIIKNIEIIRNYIFKNNINIKLYHAGILIHVKHFSNNVYLKYVNYKFFEEIIFSRNSPFDHILHRLFSALKTAIENLKK